MMHLRFNLRAIIKVYLLDGSSYAGKVDAVEPDELRLISQRCVTGALSSYGKSPITIDTDVTIHIDRDKIVCWRYAKYTDFDTSNALAVKTESDVDIHKMNNYTNDGFCKGNGKNCSTI